MTTTTRPLPEIVHDFTGAALALASSLHTAEDLQWRPALTPKPREDTTERAKGGHGDPTAQTATDERRLALRAAVLGAHVALEAALPALAEAQTALDEALRKWGA